jgi:hypothetical protein
MSENPVDHTSDAREDGFMDRITAYFALHPEEKAAFLRDCEERAREKNQLHWGITRKGKKWHWVVGRGYGSWIHDIAFEGREDTKGAAQAKGREHSGEESPSFRGVDIREYRTRKRRWAEAMAEARSTPSHVLGLTFPATAEQIKAAYREKAKLHHPDVGGDAAEFRKLRAAYESALRRATI